MTIAPSSTVAEAALGSPLPLRRRRPRLALSGPRPEVMERRLWRARRRAVDRECRAFAREFPRAAALLSSVALVDSLGEHAPPTALMGAVTVGGARPLFSRVSILADGFAAPATEALLAADAACGEHLPTTLAEALWHEFGHVLVDSLVIRARVRLPAVSDNEVYTLLLAEALEAAKTMHIEVHSRSARAVESVPECLAEMVLAARTVRDGASLALYDILKKVYG